jgi:hypothetical protein
MPYLAMFGETTTGLSTVATAMETAMKSGASDIVSSLGNVAAIGITVTVVVVGAKLIQRFFKQITG